MKNPKPNLSKGEQKAIEELAKRKDLIITNADKGGTLVIMDVEKCINEADRKLSDKHNYKKLQETQHLTIQLTGLKKKIYFLKTLLTD